MQKREELLCQILVISVFSFLPIFYVQIYSKSSALINYEQIKSKSRHTIKLEKNYLNNSSTILLYEDGIKLDSMNFSNLDFRIDSFMNINDSACLYIYSECVPCTYLLEESYQIILISDKRKLHIAFFSDYQWGRKRNGIYDDKRNISDSNEILASIKESYVNYGRIFLDSAFINGNYALQEIFYSDHGSIAEKKGFQKKYLLKYDKIKKAFFTERKVFNSLCEFATDVAGVDVKKRLTNESVLLLKFYGTCYAYYQGNWYSLYKNYFIRLDLILHTCPTC
jgi:hypothetical protein